jgi:PAS domain S-box-containing protein
MNTEAVLDTCVPQAVRRIPSPMPAALEGSLTTMLNGTGDGAFATDELGNVVGWNAAAEKLLGYTAREVNGRSCCEVLDSHDSFGNRMCYAGCQIRTILRRGEPVQAFEMRARTKGGQPIWLSVSVLATGADRGSSLAIHLLRDITATRELLSLVHERVPSVDRDVRKGEATVDLTRRELEILRLLTEGCNTADAAGRLRVSQSTVRNHVQNMLAKLGLHSRLEAVAYASRHRLF